MAVTLRNRGVEVDIDESVFQIIALTIMHSVLDIQGDNRGEDPAKVEAIFKGATAMLLIADPDHLGALEHRLIELRPDLMPPMRRIHER